MTTLPSGGMPVSMGIVGHRDISEAERSRVVQRLVLFLAAYRDRHPRTPIVVLTALAEGADQLAAEAASNVDGATVLAVLPMPVEECRRDFDDPHSRARFDSCLAAAHGVIIVSDYWPDAEQISQSFRSSETRDLAYQRCARFISLFSHILIAIWDGEEPKLIGGTADTVYHRVPQLEGVTPVRHTEFPTGRPPETTIHVPAPRLSRQQPPRLISGQIASDEIFDLRGGQAHQVWNPLEADALFQNLDELNECSLVDQQSGDEGSMVLQLLNAADTIAGRLQQTFRRVAASVLTLSVVGLVLISLVQNVSTAWLLTLSLVAVSAVGFLWWRLAHSSFKQRFQQFRVLAEGARVQQVWDEVGLSRSVADVYLTHQPEVRWIRTILRVAWLLDISRNSSSQVSQPSEEDRARSAAHEWIGGQVRYFLGGDARPGALRRNQKKARKFLKLGVFGVVVALLGVLPGVGQSVGLWQAPDWASVGGQGLWALGLGVVAVSAAYSELMAFRDVSRRYVQSIEVFQDGLARLNRIESSPPADRWLTQIQKVVEDVGSEALQETSTWFATSYDRKVRPV